MNYLKLITPLNIAEEKERFFTSDTYEPQFVYDWDPIKLEEIGKTNPELIPLRDALISQDSAAITEAGGKFFDVVFRPEDMELAQKLIQDEPEESEGGAQEIAAIATAKLAALGIDYRVEIVDRHGFKCRPDHRAKVLRVSAHLHLQFPSAESVVNHELVHIIRAVNGTYNGIAKQPGYLPTEEGLSCLIQDKLFRESTGSGFLHALEYLAAGLSRQVGLRSAYNFLREHGCSAEIAWSRGIRYKFGLTDTSRPGGLLNSAMYFYHAQLLKNLSQDELLRLFVGKIRQDQLGNYPSYSGAVGAERIRYLLGQDG